MVDERRILRRYTRQPSFLMEMLRGVFLILSAVVSCVFSPVLRPMARRQRKQAPMPRHLGSEAGTIEPTRPKEGNEVNDAPRVRSVPALINVGKPVEPSLVNLGAFSLVSVNPDFGRRNYAAVFALLQVAPGPKLLDLSAARTITSDLFKALAASWSAAPSTVRQLGIVLAFDHWAIFRSLAVHDLARLASLGIAAELFYDQQAHGAGLLAWFSDGEIVHNVAAVIESLLTRRQSASTWPLVLDAASELLHRHARAEESPELFVEAAEIALSYGDGERATAFAREALQRVGDAPSAVRCKALRALGVALMSQEETIVGTLLLDDAIAMAVTVGEPIEGATALCHVGMHAFNRGDLVRAESSLRRAIDLLAPEGQPDLLATAHHNLALVLQSLGSGDAARHAMAALELRTDKDSIGAHEDRELLARVRDNRALRN